MPPESWWSLPGTGAGGAISPVDLNEARLDGALDPFLDKALFGPERLGYWERCLTVADEPRKAAPAASRIAEIESEVVDLHRRLDRQVLNLEADEITPSLRRLIADRVTELEDAMADRKQRLYALAEQFATEPLVLADVAPLLEQLPLLADRFAELPPSEQRALFEILQLEVTYQPSDNAIDVAVTLNDYWQSIDLRPIAEDKLVPPGGLEPTLTVQESGLCRPAGQTQSIWAGQVG
jgi:hypothetical protein